MNDLRDEVLFLLEDFGIHIAEAANDFIDEKRKLDEIWIPENIPEGIKVLRLLP